MSCVGSGRSAVTVVRYTGLRIEAERCARLLFDIRRWPWAACAAQERRICASAPDERARVALKWSIIIIIRAG
eukprot:2190949-Prymnesium_polylepis.2